MIFFGFHCAFIHDCSGILFQLAGILVGNTGDTILWKIDNLLQSNIDIFSLPSHTHMETNIVTEIVQRQKALTSEICKKNNHSWFENIWGRFGLEQ